MAEEGNAAAKVAPTSKAADAASVQGSGSQDGQVKVEVGALLRSPNDAVLANPTVYQADVVEGAETTTEKPAEGAAEASPAAPAEAPAAPTEAAPADAAAAPASPATAAAPAAAGSPTPPEGGAEAAKSPASVAPGATDTTAVPAPTSAPGVAAGVTTSAGAATGSPPPTKDPYAIDIPLDKKINKRTQRKLWEEIEKRKPLVPKHVAQHIQKYAKPPFETWGCKFRGKGCSGCK